MAMMGNRQGRGPVFCRGLAGGAQGKIEEIWSRGPASHMVLCQPTGALLRRTGEKAQYYHRVEPDLSRIEDRTPLNNPGCVFYLTWRAQYIFGILVLSISN